MVIVKDTVVVAARDAWPEYQKYGAYICQAGRAFRDVSYVAFYTKGKIQVLVPRIMEVQDEVIFEQGRYKGRLGELVDFMLADGAKHAKAISKIFLLSKQTASETINIGNTIQNDQMSVTGKLTAFVQGQRYANLSDLKLVGGLPLDKRRTS